MKHTFDHAIIQKKDLLLLVLLLAGAGALALGLSLFGGTGTRVAVYVDGRQQEIHALQEDGSFLIRDGAGNENLVVIEDGTVRVEEANCPDRLCVRQGRISRSGESIICLPHRVVIAVEGREGETGTDAVVR